MRTASATPPIQSSIGDVWYNTSNSMFYCKNTNTQWIATDFENHVVDIIIVDDNDEAYKRAMSVI